MSRITFRTNNQLTDFEKLVLEKIQQIPAGFVSSYALVARAVGKTGGARAVGNALHKNPDAPRVPCHRVVKADGSLGGYAGGKKAKIKLLKNEGVMVKNDKIVDFERILYYL